MKRRPHRPDRAHPPESAGQGDPAKAPGTQPAHCSQTAFAPWAGALSETEHAAIVAAVRAMPAMTEHQIDDVCAAITAARERWHRTHREVSASQISTHHNAPHAA
jgi:hypothetical protein